VLLCTNPKPLMEFFIFISKCINHSNDLILVYWLNTGILTRYQYCSTEDPRVFNAHKTSFWYISVPPHWMTHQKPSDYHQTMLKKNLCVSQAFSTTISIL
jgi:hypothetical protein